MLIRYRSCSGQWVNKFCIFFPNAAFKGCCKQALSPAHQLKDPERLKNWVQFVWDLVISSPVPLLSICKIRFLQSDSILETELYCIYHPPKNIQN